MLITGIALGSWPMATFAVVALIGLCFEAAAKIRAMQRER